MTKTRPQLKSPPTDVLTERLLLAHDIAMGQRPVPGTKRHVFSPRLAAKATLALARLHGLIAPASHYAVMDDDDDDDDPPSPYADEFAAMDDAALLQQVAELVDGAETKSRSRNHPSRRRNAHSAEQLLTQHAGRDVGDSAPTHKKPPLDVVSHAPPKTNAQPDTDKPPRKRRP